MRLFDMLFGKPGDDLLESKIASTIEGFIIHCGIEEFIDGEWFMELRKEFFIYYQISLMRADAHFHRRSLACIRLNDLDEMSEIIRTWESSKDKIAIGSDQIEDLISAILHRMKEQLKRKRGRSEPPPV